MTHLAVGMWLGVIATRLESRSLEVASAVFILSVILWPVFRQISDRRERREYNERQRSEIHSAPNRH